MFRVYYSYLWKSGIALCYLLVAPKCSLYQNERRIWYRLPNVVCGPWGFLGDRRAIWIEYWRNKILVPSGLYWMQNLFKHIKIEVISIAINNISRMSARPTFRGHLKPRLFWELSSARRSKSTFNNDGVASSRLNSARKEEGEGTGRTKSK